MYLINVEFYLLFLLAMSKFIICCLFSFSLFEFFSILNDNSYQLWKKDTKLHVTLAMCGYQNTFNIEPLLSNKDLKNYHFGNFILDELTVSYDNGRIEESINLLEPPPYICLYKENPRIIPRFRASELTTMDLLVRIYFF